MKKKYIPINEPVVKPAVVEEISDKDLDGLFVYAQKDSGDSEKIDAPRYSYWRSVFRVFFSRKLNWVMFGILLVILLLAFIWPAISGYDGSSHPYINTPSEHYLMPSWYSVFTIFMNSEDAAEFMTKVSTTRLSLFGTDQTGDQLWDVIWSGTKTSLELAFICTAINMTVGIIVGAVWGYSKKFDKIMTEVYNVIANVPFLLIIMIFMYVMGRGFWNLVIAMTVTGWMGIAYFIRTQVIIIRDREYNLASRCLGTPISRMVTKNILPYLTSVIVTIVANELPSYISYEVFLTYLGVGLDPSKPSLGVTINTYTTYMDQNPHLFWIPVGVAALVTITLYVIGQSLGDASDPRTHMM